MVAEPEVGGKRPVRMDLEGFHTGSDVVDLGENIDLTGMALKTIFSHGCGLASTIVSQKGNHLVLMQVKA